MQIVREVVTIRAPLERLFALSTNVALVAPTLGMRAVEQPASGFVALGSRVVWRGWKFGLRSEHHTLITAFEPPRLVTMRFDGGETAQKAFFQDTQERGRFQSFHHDHFFLHEDHDATTLLEGHVFFSLPWYLGGVLAERLLLAPYIRRLVQRRFALLKELAEGDGWRTYLVA